MAPLRDPGRSPAAARIPAKAGIGLRAPHDVEILADLPDIAWLEIHSENYLLSPEAPRSRILHRLRRDYPIACHGVGLSLGSAEGLSAPHLAALAGLFEAIEPGLVSEHLSWSVVDGCYLSDLLPIPYSAAALDVVCRNIDRAQTAFRRRIAVENPARYLVLPGAEMDEPAFVTEVVRRTGCSLLLDLNNVAVSAINLDLRPAAELLRYPLDAIEEIHVAGHRMDTLPEGPVAIDDHGSPPSAAVWDLLAAVVDWIGIRPVLVEWDIDLPGLATLLGEARKAQQILDRAAELRAGHVA